MKGTSKDKAQLWGPGQTTSAGTRLIRLLYYTLGNRRLSSLSGVNYG